MANKQRLQVVTRWVDNGGIFEPEILQDLQALGAGLTISDITEQPDANMPPNPNVYIAEIEGLTAAQVALLNASVRRHILSNETYDDTDNRIVSNDKGNRPNAGGQAALKAQIKAKFAGVTDEHLKGVRNGSTTAEIVQDLITAWRQLPKG